MDGLFWNKVIGSVLALALVIFGIRELSHALVHPHQPETPGYAIDLGQSATGAATTEEAAPVISLAEWLANASVSGGERVGKKCASCHTFDNGGANKTGPNLWDIVGRDASGVEGFKYSSAMAGSGLTWDFETLDAFMAKPKEVVPGTAMSFAGLNKPKDRANLLVWLRSLSDAPVDLPALPVAEPVEAALMETVGDAASEVETTLENVASEVIEAANEVVGGGVEGATDLLEALPNVSEDAPEIQEEALEAGVEALEELNEPTADE